MVLRSQKPLTLRLISALALSIALIVAMSALWSLHTESLSSVNSSDTRQWQQPSLISDRFPELISTDDWQFDYNATEQALLKIKHTKSGELILNANSAKRLEQAVSALPMPMAQDELRRVELLIMKGLSGKAGQQLASLVSHFYAYQQALTGDQLPANTQENSDDQEQNFKRRVLLQKEYLGEGITEQLFGRQNRLNHYLYARKGINEDPGLNPAQKQQALSILQNRFKANEE